jgi:serine/threonine protein kinase
VLPRLHAHIMPHKDAPLYANTLFSICTMSLQLKTNEQNLSPQAKDLLGGLLDVNPRTRLTAQAALEHPWISGIASSTSANNALESPRQLRQLPKIGTPQAVRESGNAPKYGERTSGIRWTNGSTTHATTHNGASNQQQQQQQQQYPNRGTHSSGALNSTTATASSNTGGDHIASTTAHQQQQQQQQAGTATQYTSSRRQADFVEQSCEYDSTDGGRRRKNSI